MPTYFYETFPGTKVRLYIMYVFFFFKEKHDIFSLSLFQGWIVNMVPWIFLFPCTFLAKMMSEHLIKIGYSVTSTRKIIQTICFVTQVSNLIFLGKINVWYDEEFAAM